MSIDYKITDENVKEYEEQERIIKTISKRFMTYGYKRIKTSTFEQYDLYSKVKSSINQNEMIKVIDHKGQVLVLRPDMTIPITRKLAEDQSKLSTELRYFYVQDVFRQSFDKVNEIESTQAGVECFCESSPEADAEVIALASHTLKDLGFIDIKIELGHAGFFNELVRQIELTETQLRQLKSMIQAKNFVDIEAFLKDLPIEQEIREAIEMIPFLYGNPKDVSERAMKILFTDKMKEKIDYLIDVYEILKIYGLEDNIIMDLGLINHMGYYSDVIFQGFVEKFGQPVLMGGRYDQLGNEFGATLPAIGFACEIDSLVVASSDQKIFSRVPIDVKILYAKSWIGESITIANELRERNFSVLTFPMEKEQVNQQQCIYSIRIDEEQQTFHYKGTSRPFSGMKELLNLLIRAKGDV
ncbi:ATP phosphoribosyltransferase regulatory subunit [Sporosarcina sp. CAU 1771]